MFSAKSSIRLEIVRAERVFFAYFLAANSLKTSRQISIEAGRISSSLLVNAFSAFAIPEPLRLLLSVHLHQW